MSTGPSSNPSSNPSIRLDGLRILCVEDDADAREALAAYLRRRGGTVTVAADGEAGLAALDGGPPDIVITDIRMPRIDGLDMCRQIRARCPDAEFILVTAHNENDYLRAAIDVGIVQFIVKPLQIGELTHALAAAVKRLARRSGLRGTGGGAGSVADAPPAMSPALDDHRLQAFVDNYLGGDGEALPVGVRRTQIPSEAICGDFATFATSGDAIYALIADGTGHGLAAILPSLPVPRLFREMATRGMSLIAIADEINRRLHAYRSPGHFLAATLVQVDHARCRVEVVNCGNPPALLLGERGMVHEFASKTLALGLSEPDAFDVEPEHVEVAGPARLVIYTDGLIDTLSATRIQWDRGYVERLREVSGGDRYYDRLVGMLADATRLGTVQDDITLVEIDCTAMHEPLAATAWREPAAMAERPEEITVTERLKECTVLIVEDDDDARESLSRVVGRRVAKVVTARSGGEGLRLFQQARPQLVIADVVMPDMDGLTMVDRIRAFDANVQVILTSGSLDRDKLDLALELRIGRFLPKPIDVSKLLDSMQQGIREFDSACGRQLSSVVFMTSSLAMMVTNVAREIVAVNPAFTRLTGYSRADVVGRNPRLLSSGKHDATFYDDMWRALHDNGSWAGEIWNRRKNGALFLEWLTINAVRDDRGEVCQYVSVFADITERNAAEEKLYQMSHYDGITRLPNRVLLMDRIQQALIRAQRDKTQVAVMLMDVDHFKTINDTLGHSAGDMLLVKIADILRDCVRESDTVGRFGGDEFAIVLPNVGEHDVVARLAGVIIGRISRPYTVAGTDIQAGVSIGISVFPADGTDAETLVKNADNAMYFAKMGGRNGFRFFSKQHGEQVKRDMAIQHGIRAGLQRGEFSMVYQPKFSLSQQRIVGAEALIRWNSPSLGGVSPADFIPVAEKTGVIVDIGEWVISTVCMQLCFWRTAGIDVPPVAINISPLHFQRGRVKQRLVESLNGCSLPPSAIQIELTEGVVMNDSAGTRTMLSELRDCAIKISIDDFGTGYSSLGYLRQLPIDEIKIDRSFIKEIDVDASMAETAVPMVVIQLAHSLGLSLVAEGVETEVQRDFLARHGCDVIQGYLFSRPLSPPDFAALLAEQPARLA